MSEIGCRRSDVGDRIFSVILSAGFLLLLILAPVVQAKDTTNIEAGTGQCGRVSSDVSFGDTLSCYVANLYDWAIGAGVALAVIILMYAGYLMITSSGDPQKTGLAKEIIVGALTGLALLAGARLILNVLSIG